MRNSMMISIFLFWTGNIIFEKNGAKLPKLLQVFFFNLFDFILLNFCIDKLGKVSETIQLPRAPN